MNWISKLEELRRQGTPATLITVANHSGSSPREVGAKMIVLQDGTFFGTIGGGHLEQLAIEDARKCLDNKSSKNVKYPLGAKAGQCCGGVVELLFEVLNTEPRLYLFGAGHVGQAVCQTLAGTPFRVHVIDDRDEWIHSDKLPEETVRHSCEWEDFVAEAPWDSKDTYVAVMTHRHDLDEAIVADAVRRESRYIGLIGSDSKWTRFKQRLGARGFSNEELGRVKCPIGIRKDGKLPKEIAINFAAEILEIHHA